MKRKLKLLTIASTAVSTLTPVLMMTACSKQKNIYQTIANDAIEEFKQLAVIPHSSDPFLKEVPYELGNCWNMSCYLKERISNILGKNIFQDKYGNLVFDMPATDSSLEDAPKIALQAHLDMVFAYDQTDIEFKPDPRIWKVALVEDVVDGKKVLHSDKYRTSIGADDGIGVAIMLAILQHPEIKHGPLRFIITNCEENGAQGGSLLANETYPELLKDFYYVINLDGEDLGEIYVAASGAVGSYYYINSSTEKGGPFIPTTAKNFFKITLDNFLGGHSGVDIAKRRDNALRFMNDFLTILNNDLPYDPGAEPAVDKRVRLNSISTPGTTVYNAIPKTCEVVICSDEWETKTLAEMQTIVETAFQKTIEHRKALPKHEGDLRTDFTTEFDPDQYANVTCTVTQAKPKHEVALTAADTYKVIFLQSEQELQYGIKNWPTAEQMEQLTGEQTSSNIGPAEGQMTSDLKFEYKLSTYSRSSDSSKVNTYYKMNEAAALECGATWKYDAKFEPWHVDTNKQLLNLAQRGWGSAGIETKPVRTHGGLECSFWHELMEADETKAGKTAIVSFGPQLHDVHKPTEMVELDTVPTCIEAVVYMLEHAAELTLD